MRSDPYTHETNSTSILKGKVKRKERDGTSFMAKAFSEYRRRSDRGRGVLKSNLHKNMFRTSRRVERTQEVGSYEYSTALNDLNSSEMEILSAITRSDIITR